ncbi:hypothetical protein DPMN_064724 [Dreissena polymorpha]|uniref:Uncharacterized protein n=1 Tax=Dreissena polymorpha TaxID=45954 RepID=A0A9D4HME9_DREPO|nr:hypothetical protein DPMN_064724 [Dreissena polymorpha]
MRYLKNTGCLTRGSGYTENMQHLQTLSAPIASEFNSAMQDYTDLAYNTSPQHKVSTEAHQKRYF